MSASPRPARPRRLRPGDSVAVITPAGPAEADKLAAGIAVLESWGLHVARHAHAGTAPQRYLADTDFARAKEFERAWSDESIAGVLAARGGYGCQRMIDHVEWDQLRACSPKVFAGSSDITALHAAIGAQLDVPSLLSPMPAGSYFDEAAAQHLRETLLCPEHVRVLGTAHAEPLVAGQASGVTAGGNLSLLAASVGTPEHRPPRAGIAVLEDVGEQPYRLDRKLTQLLRCGWFDDVAGIALGSWTGCGPTEQVRDLLLERLGALGVPMVFGLGFGHQTGSLTVPLGVRATLDAERSTLTLAEPALS